MDMGNRGISLEHGQPARNEATVLQKSWNQSVEFLIPALRRFILKRVSLLFSAPTAH